MTVIDSIAAQVKHNCNISDAKYWGNYSPCGLLLRMRDLFRIEHAMKPWEGVNHKEIGVWMQQRESLWQDLEEQEYRDIQVNGKAYRPFDVKGINQEMEKLGYVYSAGYGNLLKPMFMLAGLSVKSSKGKYTIYISEREIARDLSTSPAMIQGNTILLRRQTMHLFFWSKFEEMKTSRCSGALLKAFSEYGISKDIDHRQPPEFLDRLISHITEEELATYIHHEIGEASQRRILGRWWKELLVSIPYSRAELYVRSLKDIMADTCRSGTLSHIIAHKKAGSLGFYISLLSGYRRSIFPDVLPAYEEFTKTRKWKVIEKARAEGYKRAGDRVRTLKALFDKGPVSAERIEQEFI